MSRIEIVIDAVNRGLGNIAKVAGELGHVGEAAKQSGNALERFHQLTTGASAALDVLGKASGFVTKALDATVNKFVDYANEVDNLARVSGESAEETSKLIQVADDARVSYETLQVAAEKAARKGIDFTTEALARTSEEYLRLTDSTARAQLVIERYGIAAGPELAKLLEKGPEAIRAAGEEAERTGLIMSGQGVQNAKAYQEGLDNLGDMVEGLALRIGGGLVPELTKAVQAIDVLVNWNARIEDAMRKHRLEVSLTEATYPEFRAEMMRMATAAGYSIDQYGDLRNQLGQVVEADFMWQERMVETQKRAQAYDLKIQGLTKTTHAYYENLRQLRAEQGAHSDLVEGAEGILDRYRLTAELTAADIANLAESQGRANQVMDTLGLAMNVLEPQAAAFRDRIGELSGEATTYRDRIAELEARSWLTQAQRDELEETKTKLGEVQGAIALTTEEYNRQMREFVYDEAVKQATASGGELTLAEAQALDTMAQSLGLVNKASLVQVQEIQTGIGVILTLQDQGKLSAEEAGRELAALAGRQSTWYQRQLKEGGAAFDEYGERLSDLPGEKRTNVHAETERAKSELDIVAEKLQRIEDIGFQFTVSTWTRGGSATGAGGHESTGGGGAVPGGGGVAPGGGIPRGPAGGGGEGATGGSVVINIGDGATWAVRKNEILNLISRRR